MASAAESTHDKERKSIQNSLLEALKECQTRFGGGQELATEQDARVVNLCTRLEQAFGHGARKNIVATSTSNQQATITELVRGLLNNESTYRENGCSAVYQFISTFLSRHELERFQLLRNVQTDMGRSRAWIRCTLNEHTLERYCRKFFSAAEKVKVEKFYEPWAFIRDEELCALLETMAAGMKSILFALNVDSSKLDPELDLVGPVVESTSLPEGFDVPAPILNAEARGQIRKKKKRNIISFDSAPSSCVASPSDLDGGFFPSGGPSGLKPGLTPIHDGYNDLSYGDLIPVKFDNEDPETQSNQSGKSEQTCAFSVKSNSTSLSESELREALETMVVRRKQLEGEVEDLRSRLQSEVDKGKRITEKMSRVEQKQGAMVRENETLKGQLRRYVAAVQMLKSKGTYQELHSLESLPGIDDVSDGAQCLEESHASLGYVVDPTDYESKLVQVAEMHAELMEFNERLQKQLVMKESSIRRLRDELTDLRGPLAEENDSSSDEHSVTSDYDTQSQFRPSINIWIPSAFLAGHGSDAFHVYQIYIRIGEDEWNVYRRYSQFYSLHKGLSKNNSPFNSFDFPPKKSIGNKDAKLVQERRKRLQRYLRCVINWLLQSNCRLSQNAEKSTLIEIMPFFGDRDQAHVTRPRRRSPVRRAQDAQSYYNGL